MLSNQESACPGIEIPAPQTPIPAPKTPTLTTQKESKEKEAEWGKTEIDRWLTKIHVNCGHAPSAQMAHCLKEAGYDKKQKRCRELKCQLCDQFNSVVPARPTKMMRCRTLGKVVAMDFPSMSIESSNSRCCTLWTRPLDSITLRWQVRALRIAQASALLN